jgi:hypothetical protein
LAPFAALIRSTAIVMVLLQQVGQLVAGGFAVEAGHRIADVLLVFQQALGGRLLIGLISDGGDDVVARLDHMVGPQLPHVLMKRGRRGQRRRHVILRAGRACCGRRRFLQSADDGQRSENERLHVLPPAVTPKTSPTFLMEQTVCRRRKRRLASYDFWRA